MHGYGNFLILDTPDGTQWITNGQGAWPIEGVSIGEASIPALFDIEQKKAEKLMIKERHYSDPRFTLTPLEGEEPMQDMGAVWFMGDLYRVVQGANGIEFINVANLKPAENKDGFMEFRRRGTLIACFGSLFVAALVAPEGKEKSEAIMKQLYAIVEIGVCTSTTEETWISAGSGEKQETKED